MSLRVNRCALGDRRAGSGFVRTKKRLWRVDRSGLSNQVKRRLLKQVLKCGYTRFTTF